MENALLEDAPTLVQEARLWQANGWTARVIKNEEDDGWAVAMTQDGQVEPALIGPWTMGRDKKNPKPLDVAAFNTLVKTAAEVIRRHEQQLAAQLHKELEVEVRGGRIMVALDIELNEDEASATLTATSLDGTELGRTNVKPDFALTRSSADEWVGRGYQRIEID